MAPDDGSEELGQREEIELLSGIPFSKGPFKTKEGPRSPLRKNLYLNNTMRRFLLKDENPTTGTVQIGEETFEIRQARHSAEDGRLRNIVHPGDVGDIKEFLGEELKVDPEIQEQTGVEFHCSEFKTKKGARFPEGRTIYATKKLRTLLEVEDKTGEVEIDGKKYKVRQGKKPVDGDKFVNVVHPVEELAVQRFLANKLRGLQAVSDNAKDRVDAALNVEEK